MSSSYKHQGLPLTPGIAAELIFELFGGKTIRRSELIPVVKKEHLQRGGQESNATDLGALFKRALSMLRKKGLASDTGAGARYCRILDYRAEAIETIEIEESDTESNGEAEDLVGAVYVYYLPAYRNLAEIKRETTWPMKVGMSGSEPELRVAAQTTGLPEKPIVALTVECDEPSALEDAIHAVLRLRGKHVDDSPGTEWFRTSVSEIIDIVRFIDPNLVCTTIDDFQPALSQNPVG